MHVQGFSFILTHARHPFHFIIMIFFYKCWRVRLKIIAANTSFLLLWTKFLFFFPHFFLFIVWQKPRQFLFFILHYFVFFTHSKRISPFFLPIAAHARSCFFLRKIKLIYNTTLNCIVLVILYTFLFKKRKR